MATPNLGFATPIESQAQKTVTIANALIDFDKATQGDTPLTITGNKAVTADEFTLGFSLELSGTPGSPFDLTVPSTKRFFRVENGSDAIATVKTASGTTVDVAVGEFRLLYCDGSNISEEGSSSGMTGVESQEGGTPVVSNTVAFNFNAAEFDITDETASVSGIALADRSLETKVQRVTTDQSFDENLTQCQWNDEILDEFAGHDNSTDNERIVIGTEKVDVSAKIKLLNLDSPNTVDARIVRYNSSDALQEVVARSRAEDNPEITLNAINVRGAAAGDYLVVDVLSADTAYNLDRTESYFLVRRAASGGGGGGATQMDELSDADMTTEAPVAGDHMIFDGSNWVPAVGAPTRTTVTLSGASTSESIPDGCTHFHFVSGQITLTDGTENLFAQIFHTGDTVITDFDVSIETIITAATVTFGASNSSIIAVAATASATIRALAGHVYSPRDASKKTLADCHGYNFAGNDIRHRDSAADAAFDDDTIRFLVSGGTITGSVEIEWFYN